MNHESLPGAELEAPDVFQSLMAPYWPRLPLALGYRGIARWLALYFSLDDVIYSDGESLGTGDTHLFLTFKRHPSVAPHLAGAQLGNAETAAHEWLVLDTHQQLLYLAGAEEARKHLAKQWPVYEAPLEYTPAELARLLANLEASSDPADEQERVAEILREGRANHRLLQVWLNEQPGAPTNNREPEEGSHHDAAS